MFGTRDEFEYFECASCCCLSLKSPPDDFARYYPKDKYYSYHSKPTLKLVRNPIRRWIKKKRDDAQCFGHQGLFGRLAIYRANLDVVRFQRWFRSTNVRHQRARILDIGCGDGEMLVCLANIGFTDLTGVDPFLPQDSVIGPVQIYAEPLSILRGNKYDFIMLNHTLEHMQAQHETIRCISDLLKDDGTCMIRIPIVSRGPWKEFGVYWAEIDSPRHTVLHSELSLKYLVESAGLRLRRVDYEAEPFSYAVSEMYRRDVPLCDAESGKCRDWRTFFSSSEINRFTTMAEQYNAPGWAARAAFFVDKSSLTNCEATFPEQH